MTMEVILLENIQNLGNLGDQVKVRSGYARNYLLPQGKAAFATAENIAHFEARRTELEKVGNELLVAAQQRVEQFEGLAVTIQAQAGDAGHLYGSVGTREIAEAATAAGAALDKNEVQLPDGALRELGEYEITVQLHSEVSRTLKLVIEALA